MDNEILRSSPVSETTSNPKMQKVLERLEAETEHSQQKNTKEGLDRPEAITTFQQLKDTLQAELDERVLRPIMEGSSRTVSQEAARQRAHKLRHPKIQNVLKLLSKGASPDIRRRVQHHMKFIIESHRDTNGLQEAYHIYGPLMGALWR